ncbi:MFS transporter [Streptomyces mashuensis]|uniref:MFS transporter n=1 Tax=Streptomyces mashuensis TaxID=33904 RepID=A0A919EFC8_9ACTN|nr:MFS transporter [Streptomyces mashuensis]GHF64585.1 MFS transporter [Streptomyces mashuensis]
MNRSTTLTSSVAAASAGRWSPRLWGLLLVLAGNMLIDALEVSVAVVALPSVGDDLGLPPTSLQWAMSGFALGFGSLMLFGARVVALLGRRRMYLLALLGFAAASVISALASDPALFVATRFAKGFCAALTAPTGLAILSTTFAEGPDRDRAVSVYTLAGASGFTAGLLLSGALTSVDWRLTFVFPAPVVLVLYAFCLRLVPPDPQPGGPRRYDVAGAATFSGALLALVYGIASVPQHGWGSARVWASFAATVALLVAFTTVERQVPQPLVRFSVLADPAMRRSALGAAALNGSYLGLLFIVTVQTQDHLGWGPMRTALAMVPASLPLAVTALLSGRLVRRFGAPRLIAVGAAGPLLGYALYLRLPAHPHYATDVLPTMLLVGAGFVASFAALNMQAVSGFPADRRGEASGVYQTAVQIGAALMLVLTAALVEGYGAPTGASARAVADGFRPAVRLVTAVGLLGLLVALTGVLPRRRPADTPLPEERT